MDGHAIKVAPSTEPPLCYTEKAEQDPQHAGSKITSNPAEDNRKKHCELHGQWAVAVLNA